MKTSELQAQEVCFDQVCETLFSALTNGEDLNINLIGEKSFFSRLNNAKVRQTTDVEDGFLTLMYARDQRAHDYHLPFTGDLDTDLGHCQMALSLLRERTPHLPVDPFYVSPKNHGSSMENHPGQLLPADQVPAALLAPAQGLDLTGLYASGVIYRANRNHTGQRHWFATEHSAFDYSLMAANEKTVKDCFASKHWNPEYYRERMQDSRQQLTAMTRPSRTIEPGSYRVYLAPAAVAAILELLAGSAFSESAFRQGRSPLANLRHGQRLSPLLNLRENFALGGTTRFNAIGELAPEQLDLLRAGEIANNLVSVRTAEELGLISNAADFSESCRAPEILPGQLPRAQILEKLGTGLYLSNLHYLNWSDVPKARLTGMTRFACFWVENGEIRAPIENLRFDDSVFDFLGPHLEGLTDFQEYQPDVGTYFHRQLGGALVPGLLTGKMTFTL